MVFVPPSTGDVPNVSFFSGFCTSVDRRCSKCFIFGWFLYLRRLQMFQMFHFWMVFVPPSTGDVPNVPNVSNITCSKLCTGRILPILRHEEVKAGRQRGETRGEREGRKKECKGLKRTQKFTGRRTGHIQMHVRCDAKDSGASRRVACSGSQHPWR